MCLLCDSPIIYIPMFAIFVLLFFDSVRNVDTPTFSRYNYISLWTGFLPFFFLKNYLRFTYVCGYLDLGHIEALYTGKSSVYVSRVDASDHTDSKPII